MSGAPTRRTTRSTRLVDQNAGQSAPTTRKREAPAAKKPATRATASKSTTVPPPTATTAPTAAGRKRKALGDNTNAEKKKKQPVKTDKVKGKEKEPVKPTAKSVAADTPGTSASTSMRLVVELPLRKRPVSQKPKTTSIAATKTVDTTTVKPSKPVTRSASVKPTNLKPKQKHVQPGNTLEPIPEPKPSPQPKPSLSAPPVSAPDAQPDAPTTETLEIEPEGTVDEPPPKRRRSNDNIPIPVEATAVVEASGAVLSEENDNPFQASVGSKRIEAVGVGSARLWDDLDEGDADDPLMVSEYVIEIYDYLRELEIRTMPSSVYTNSQPELDWKMRGILMDWMIQVHARFRLLPETLYIAANIVDRFLSLRVVSRVKLQMVGITALFIASKYEEIMAPSVQNFLRVSDAPYEEQEIMTAEKYVLRTLDWNLSYPTPIGWLRRASKADGYDSPNRNLAKFLLEISIVEERLLKYTPSLLAAAALWLARLMLDRTEWDANLEHYSGYSEKQLIPCANIMLNYLFQSPTNHESLWKKYSGRKFSKFAVLARKWALARWPPESRRSSDEEKDDEEAAEIGVDLAAALPILREQIQSGNKASVSPEVKK